MLDRPILHHLEEDKYIQNYQINTEKIQEYSKMSTSEESIKEYFVSLKII